VATGIAGLEIQLIRIDVEMQGLDFTTKMVLPLN
jgi:hypothetical protein